MAQVRVSSSASAPRGRAWWRIAASGPIGACARRGLRNLPTGSTPRPRRAATPRQAGLRGATGPRRWHRFGCKARSPSGLEVEIGIEFSTQEIPQ